MNDWKSGTFTRRDFLGTTLGAAAGFSIYPTGHRLRFANRDWIHQLLARNAGLVVRALRTVGAILGTAARLYREQPAELNFVGLVESAMRKLRLENQLGERKIIDSADFVARPVVADFHRQVSSFRISRISKSDGTNSKKPKEAG